MSQVGWNLTKKLGSTKKNQTKMQNMHKSLHKKPHERNQPTPRAGWLDQVGQGPVCSMPKWWCTYSADWPSLDMWAHSTHKSHPNGSTERISSSATKAVWRCVKDGLEVHDFYEKTLRSWKEILQGKIWSSRSQKGIYHHSRVLF